MKKQKAKKAGGASKKKDDKLEAADPEPSPSTDKAEEKAEDAPAESTEQKAADEESEEPSELPKPTHKHGRQPSVAVESRLRSASFYRGEGITSPTSPNTASGDAVGDIYRKQAQRIEELERENKRLQGDAENAEKRWHKMEEELEELREGKGDVALAVERGVEVEKLVCSSALRTRHP